MKNTDTYTGTNEFWEDIKDYEGRYQVSNLGQVRSLYKNGKIKLLSLIPNPDGYMKIKLYKDGKVSSRYVHRLVVQTFLSYGSYSIKVKHENKDRSDNSLENLSI